MIPVPTDGDQSSSTRFPKSEQMEVLDARPKQESLVIVNLNLHRQEGIAPDTGESSSRRAAVLD